MTRHVLAVVLLLAAAGPVSAEENFLRWRGHEAASGRTSDWLVGGMIAADTIHSLRSDRKVHALLEQGCGIGLSQGLVFVGKHAFNRERPDQSDHFSMPSGHTATAYVSGWSWRFGVPFAITAGGLRMAANKHHLTDTLAGAGVALFSQWVCRSF